MKARVLGLALAVLLPGAVAAAQPTCSGNQHLMSWPDSNPVWQFCWLRPVDSSGQNGSGLEISDVYYDGHLVLKRAHVPIVNVLYPNGGWGPCYRDWMDQEQAFLSNNVISPGYSEPTSPCPHPSDGPSLPRPPASTSGP